MQLILKLEKFCFFDCPYLMHFVRTNVILWNTYRCVFRTNGQKKTKKGLNCLNYV